MTVALIFLTVGAGYLLWTLLLHLEEIHTDSDYEVSQQKKMAALLFLTLAGLIIGTLAVLLVEVQLLFTPASS